jgi:hypothetical protein
MNFRFFSAVLAITTILTASLMTTGCTGSSGGPSASSGSGAPAVGTGPGSHPNKNTDTGAGPGIR